jgi:hypothetical protein
MTPKISDLQNWQRAELLMQPAFIRLVDNIRKQLEQSTWQGSYQEVPIWAEDVPSHIRDRVTSLQTQLKSATSEQAAAIETQLATLPAPHPGYLLCLKHNQQQVNVDLWELCYQICFENYEPVEANRSVDIDTSLIDAETGEVDWHRLDSKTRQIVEQVFNTLPE